MDLWTKTAEEFKLIVNLSIEHKLTSNKLEIFTNIFSKNM